MKETIPRHIHGGCSRGCRSGSAVTTWLDQHAQGAAQVDHRQGAIVSRRCQTSRQEVEGKRFPLIYTLLSWRSSNGWEGKTTTWTTSICGEDRSTSTWSPEDLPASQKLVDHGCRQIGQSVEGWMGHLPSLQPSLVMISVQQPQAQAASGLFSYPPLV